MSLDHLYKANLSLGGLDMPNLREWAHAIRDKTERELAWYKAEYGDRWHDVWEDDHSDGTEEDIDASSFNTMILYGTMAGCLYHWEFEQLEARMHELYGDEYETLKNHQPWDERVVELLLAEAVRTGEWRRLPKDLWMDYHEKVGPTEWLLRKRRRESILGKKLGKKKAPSPRMAEMGLRDVIFDFKCEIPAHGGNLLARSVSSSRSAISLCAWGRLPLR